jgi:hypothetical protein
VREQVGSELGCQALLRGSVMYVMAPWISAGEPTGAAIWDGVLEDLGAGRDSMGSIDAVSFHVRVADFEDRQLYFYAGGIRTADLLVEREVDGKVESEFVVVDPNELLADPAINRAAIERALERLSSADR